MLFRSASLNAHGYFNVKEVSTILDEHFSRRKRHDTLIWALLIFQVWHQLYMRQGSGIKG